MILLLGLEFFILISFRLVSGGNKTPKERNPSGMAFTAFWDQEPDQVTAPGAAHRVNLPIDELVARNSNNLHTMPVPWLELLQPTCQMSIIDNLGGGELFSFGKTNHLRWLTTRTIFALLNLLCWDLSTINLSVTNDHAVYSTLMRARRPSIWNVPSTPREAVYYSDLKALAERQKRLKTGSKPGFERRFSPATVSHDSAPGQFRVHYGGGGSTKKKGSVGRFLFLQDFKKRVLDLWGRCQSSEKLSKCHQIN